MRLIRFWPVLAGMLVGFSSAAVQAQEQPGSVTLTWTAPGDDSLSGTASRYDLRFSLFPINDLNFVYCGGPGGLPRPAAAGTVQRFTVFGLIPGLRYYFALKTADERLNWSLLSNIVAFAGKAVGIDPDRPSLQFASPIPNPARSATGFSYAIPAAGRVQVDIFDVQGRMVRRLADSFASAGAGLLTWDLRDLRGDRVVVGIYMVRANLGGTVFTQRVLVAR